MKFPSVLSLVAGLAFSTTLQAGTIIFDAATQQLAPVPGLTFSATGGDVVYGEREGFGLIGVTGPGLNVEINEGQSLILSFSTPQFFTNLILGLLFDGDEFGDSAEIAGATIDGFLFQFTLTPSSDTIAVWNGASGTVTNLSPAIAQSGGVWSIADPFGGLAVNTLTLSPLHSPGSGSDFGLIGFATTNNVPDSTSTLGLMTGALAAVAAFSRRLVR